MSLKAVAIDDEPFALSLIQAYAARLPFLSLVSTFDDAIAGAAYLETHPPDLLFIDINMPDITGMELVKKLSVRPMVIFTTAHKNFASDAFELDAIDYLLKPIDYERFERAVKKAKELYDFRQGGESVEKALIVRSEYQLVKIPLTDIEYIESMEDYLKIHLATGRFVMTLMTVKAVLEKLPPAQFQRIHRSYVIAVTKVKAVVNRKVRIGNTELPVSDRYADFIRNWKKG